MRSLNMARKIFLLILFLSLGIYSGCGQSAGLQKAQHYEKQSQGHYKHALSIYKGLINKGKDLDRLYFELGRLYYMHGDFSNAFEALKRSGDLEAKKLLGISLFRMGNFTDALEAFNKYEIYPHTNCNKTQAKYAIGVGGVPTLRIKPFRPRAVIVL